MCTTYGQIQLRQMVPLKHLDIKYSCQQANELFCNHQEFFFLDQTEKSADVLAHCRKKNDVRLDRC